MSSADANFATQELIASYLQGGDNMLMCLYDLQKAFDFAEYSVLLDGIFEVGVNGKMWRLLRAWCTSATHQVRLGERLCRSYCVVRRVKQGSVLSPALFILVMDPLLCWLDSSELGLSVSENYAGGFLHVDYIRTLSSGVGTLKRQSELINFFADERFFELNVQKW